MIKNYNSRRPTQSQERDVRSYKNSPQQHIPASTHTTGPYSSVPVSNYNPMRYIHPTPYAPAPGATPVTFRESLYSSSRNTPSLVERGNVDFVRNEQIKQRISLLPTTADYLSIPRNRLHQGESYREQMGGPPPQSSETPLKKIRLGEPPKSEIQRNLRVETRQDDSQPAPTYNPQVEAISPTLPAENLQDDANFRSTKDDLLHGIAKVDREITKTELQISKLKRKQQDLEEAAKKPAVKTEEEEVPQPKHQSPAQKIYAENRKKAHDAHMLLATLGPKIHLPLYNQPSDTGVYHENKKKHVHFRKRLLENLRRKHVDREIKESHLTATYSLMVQNWFKKVEKVENSQKRKSKDSKNREYFEKIFPKLRKQREDRERFNRVGARVKSEADIEEIMDGLQEQEMEDKKMRSYAVVPPLLLDAKQRSVYYVNNNGQLDDFAADYKEKQLLNVWTQSEKDIFKDKYLQTPKNFGNVSQYVERKSVCDCVQYYYLSKKTENYKRLLRKSRQRQRTRNPQSKVNSGAVANANLDILATASGVTTRLQREQLQKQEPLPQSVNPGLEGHSSFLLDSQPPPLLLPSEVKPEKKKDDKDDKKKKDEDDSTDDEPIDPIGGDMENVTGIACAICKTESHCSRALPRSQASQYGLKEEEVPIDARVCNLCRCKAVRSRFTNCPIPTCPNAKGHRVKRLRPLPGKWIDLAPSLKDPIAAEFQIDDSVTKCCSVCFNRISRRIGVGMDIGNPEEGQLLNTSGIFLQWSEDDIDSLKKAIKIHGLRWDQVSQAVGKSQHQCMNFYFSQHQKLGFDDLIPEDKPSSEERKPVLTDEEESGSSTSSCDEVGPGGIADTAGDSDTASAPSPLPNQVNPEPTIESDKLRSLAVTPPPPQIVDESRERTHSENTEHSQSTSSPQPKSSASLPPTLYPAKEDYDSSATTADEGQGGGETDTPAARASTPKREEDPSSPLTVKDLMLGVIEMQLMKNQGQVQSSSAPGGPPTISSILKSDHHSISYNASREKSSRTLDLGRDSLATVSVVNTHHTHQQMPELPKEGLVVVQVQQAMREPPREPEGVTLDLSIKKPRESSSSQPSKIQHQMSSQNTVFRVSQPPEQQGFFHQQLPPPLGPKLSPGVISGSNTTTAPSKPQPQCGSIIHGTPVSSPNIYSQNRYDQPPSSALIHQVSQHKESGSITQGTPVHQRGSMYPNTEYFQKRNMPASAGYFSPRPASYNVEQRQIIMNDYITSQQMHGPGSSAPSRSSRDKMYYQSNTRQGVIQRHNTKPPSPGVSHYPPGHEAFSSLVDVAVRQPSLPVPPPISMSHDHKNIQDEKRHLHEGLGERFNRDSPHERYPSRESERYMRDPHPPKSHSQRQDSREQQQPSQQQARESVSHATRESYQTSQLHMDREVQQQMQREHHREREHREREHREHREREHHNQQSQKIRDSHISHIEMRMGRPPMSGYQQRLMHETHHQIDQRLIPNPSFREQPTSSQSSSVPSRSHATQEQSTDSQSNRGRCQENSTLTAASLIDAIITHQINQSSEAQTTSVPSGTTTTPQAQPTRPGDRLFQSFHRECSESNGKLSPIKSSDSSKTHSVPSQPMQAQILEHVDMYNNPAASQNIRSSSMYPGYDTWKLRRALQQKEEQGNVIEKTDEHMSRFYQEAPVPLSPLDYVKNRIAEVMRTSEEESGTGKDNEGAGSADTIQDEGEHGGSHTTSHSAGHPTSHTTVHTTSHSSSHPTAHTPGHSAASTFLTQSHTYAYPYSALSLNTSAPTSVPLPTHPTTKTAESSIPEPAPLLSSQYEPLSDED